MSIAVAIDGPVGAGKSSIAKECSKRLGFIYVDTGAMYRCIGLFCDRNGVDMDDPVRVSAALSHISLDVKIKDGTQHIYLNGYDVSDEIRLPEISMAASKVSAIPAVRAFLLQLQRDMAESRDVIMDGRDIGTVVLPNADVKIFLTASPESRAMRRYKELKEKGASVGYDEVLADLKERDYNDSHRKIAPLKPANDSITVDTTLFTLEESIKKITHIIREHM